MRLNLEAETLSQLFAQAAEETTRRLCGVDLPGAALREKIVVEASDLSALLQNWIDTLLHLFQDQRMAFSRFEFHELRCADHRWRLRADVTGDWVPAVAAWRCHGAQVIQAPPGFQARFELRSS